MQQIWPFSAGGHARVGGMLRIEGTLGAGLSQVSPSPRAMLLEQDRTHSGNQACPCACQLRMPASHLPSGAL